MAPRNTQFTPFMKDLILGIQAAQRDAAAVSRKTEPIVHECEAPPHQSTSERANSILAIEANTCKLYELMHGADAVAEYSAHLREIPRPPPVQTSTTTTSILLAKPTPNARMPARSINKAAKSTVTEKSTKNAPLPGLTPKDHKTPTCSICFEPYKRGYEWTIPSRNKLYCRLQCYRAAQRDHDRVQPGDGHYMVHFPCGHTFGSTCISAWMTSGSENKNRCPICRTSWLGYRGSLKEKIKGLRGRVMRAMILGLISMEELLDRPRARRR